jgi:2'-5' RNA ligase
VVKFKQYEMMEERIIQRLHTITSGVSEFKIEFDKFGSFPTHSIYINVATKVPIQSLVKQLKLMQQLLKHKDTKPHFIEEIGITIARKLLPWQYEKAWLEYSHSNFTGRFIADHMLLLKRPVGGTYKVLRKFEFMNMPVNTKQGDLFG